MAGKASGSGKASRMSPSGGRACHDVHPNPCSSVTNPGATIATASIAELLAAWRAAERRWERPASPDATHAAALAVVAAWTAYQDAALGSASSEFVLVADDAGAYVAATRGVEACLGYRPEALLGLRVADLAAEPIPTTAAQWTAFLAAGRLDGQFRLRTIDGRIVNLRYQARAHHPVPGYHMSRLWLDADRDEPPSRMESA